MKQQEDIEPWMEDNTEINIRAMIMGYARYWYWMVLSVIIAVLITVVYLIWFATPLYSVNADILITDKDSKSSANISALKDLDLLGGGGASVEDEMSKIKSRQLMTKTIVALGMDKSYFIKNGFKQKEILLQDLPFELQWQNLPQKTFASPLVFSIKVQGLHHFNITNESSNDDPELMRAKLSIKNPKILSSQIGQTYQVVVNPLIQKVQYYRENLMVSNEKNTNVIKISLVDASLPKAEAIINQLIKQYIQDAIEEKSMDGQKTIAFVQERLAEVSKDLNNLDRSVQDFKQANRLTDLAAEAEIALNTASTTNQSMLALETKSRIAGMMMSHISQKPNDLIPVNLGIDDPTMAPLITKYNELVLEKSFLAQSATPSNPMIQSINEDLSRIKSSLSKSLQTQKNAIGISLNSAQQQNGSWNKQIQKLPQKEREFLNIKRQQQIIEQLYLYLLQKKEEAGVSAAVVPQTAKIIDPAYGNPIPVAPKKPVVLLAALLLGFLIPIVLIYIIQLLDTKVRSIADVEKVLKQSIIGMIPKSELMAISGDTPLAEAFRFVRTNTDFILRSKGMATEKGKVVVLTSTTSGEGKTFVSSGLSMVYSFMQNKKILIIGADIRNPKLTESFNINNQKGLTNYLIADQHDYTQLIQKDAQYPNIDIINAGPIPPNPSELLQNGRLDQLLEQLKNNYDYILLDTAPLSLVADTHLFHDLADVVLFIIRVNYLEKSMLPFVADIFKKADVQNVGLILNDVEFGKGGFSYGYGQYGYGYGAKNIQEPFYKRWFKF